MNFSEKILMWALAVNFYTQIYKFVYKFETKLIQTKYNHIQNFENPNFKGKTMPRQALRENLTQHQPKNRLSKDDDLKIDEAMQKTKKYLEKRFQRGGESIISRKEIITLR